jgi:hypothetical protein
MSSRCRALSAVLLLAIAGGCARKPLADPGLKPPFRAQFGDLILDVPDRPDLYQATMYSFGLVVKVCERGGLDESTRPLCEKLTKPIVNYNGLYTLVKSPQPGHRFDLLKERPKHAREPPSAAMTPIPPERIDTKILNGTGEAYELSRLFVIDPKSPLLTTANGWPLARCDTGPSGGRFCTIGFLIKGAFVETHLYAEDGVALDQKQVWDVASALDAKLRDLSPPPGR